MTQPGLGITGLLGSIVYEAASFLPQDTSFSFPQKTPLADTLEIIEPTAFEMHADAIFKEALHHVGGNVDAFDERVKGVFKKYGYAVRALDLSEVSWEQVPKAIHLFEFEQSNGQQKKRVTRIEALSIPALDQPCEWVETLSQLFEAGKLPLKTLIAKKLLPTSLESLMNSRMGRSLHHFSFETRDRDYELSVIRKLYAEGVRHPQDQSPQRKAILEKAKRDFPTMTLHPLEDKRRVEHMLELIQRSEAHFELLELPFVLMKFFLKMAPGTIQGLFQKCTTCTLRFEEHNHFESDQGLGNTEVEHLAREIDATKVRSLHLKGLRLNHKFLPLLMEKLQHVTELVLDRCSTYGNFAPETYGKWAKLQKIVIVAKGHHYDRDRLLPGTADFYQRLIRSLPLLQKAADNPAIAAFYEALKVLDEPVQVPKETVLRLEVTRDGATFSNSDMPKPALEFGGSSCVVQ